ncbi:MAG: GNAT family N-acetyltransferase [Methanoregulaceae archaeon]
MIANEVSIRPMLESELGEVIRIDEQAFTAHYSLRPRTMTNVAYASRPNPGGCFVARSGGIPVGFIFSRTWGSIGWVGTFDVDTAHRVQGVGRPRSRPCRRPGAAGFSPARSTESSGTARAWASRVSSAL